MHILIGLIIGNLIGSLVFRILATIGVGLVGYYGFDFLKAKIISGVNSFASGIPADAFNLIALTGIDIYFTMVVSTLFAAFLLKKAGKFLSFK